MSEVSAAAAKAFIAMAPEHKVLMGFIQNQELVMLQCEFPFDRIDFSKGNGVERLALLFMRNKNWYTLGSP